MHLSPSEKIEKQNLNEKYECPRMEAVKKNSSWCNPLGNAGWYIYYQLWFTTTLWSHKCPVLVLKVDFGAMSKWKLISWCCLVQRCLLKVRLNEFTFLQIEFAGRPAGRQFNMICSFIPIKRLLKYMVTNQHRGKALIIPLQSMLKCTQLYV